MSRRREINVFSTSFLDLITGALGAVIILYVAVPKAKHAQDAGVMESVLRSREAEIANLRAEITPLRELQESARRALSENEELKRAAETASPPQAPPAEDGETGLDVGFKFKGKKVVFAIDTSKSMLHEDRMGQVKAGLRMLITSMPAGYEVDVVQFPLGMRSPYKPLFGRLRRLAADAKHDVFDFIRRMKPDGGTPTRDVLGYILGNYPDLTDVVLLTDGEPSLHNSAFKDDIHDLLGHVRKLNPGTRVQINAIGVGDEVLHDKAGNPYQFLKLLAEQNAGFFVGF